MSKVKIAVVLSVVLVSVTLLLPVWSRHKSGRDLVMKQSLAIGQDLVRQTNSPHLVSSGTFFQKRLAQFLAAPGRVEAVRYGDEPRPGVEEEATSRVYLINDRGERLALRLKQESPPTQFRIVGWWVPTSAPAPEGK